MGTTQPWSVIHFIQKDAPVNFGKSNISYMNFSNNTLQWVPLEFREKLPSRLQYLNLSSNNITGTVPDLLSDFDSLQVIDLSSNGFRGLVINVSSTLVSLDLSRNKFHGGISFLCQIVDGLTHLDLSNNSFSGQLPNCLWNFQSLKVLNLGYNNLSGRLPPSVKYLSALEVLYLYNNKFSGELPLSLRNCTKLTFLDLGNNKFSNCVPVWIGELSNLYVLSLTSNDFFGTIPLQLCQLVSLQILDLSMNNLNGTIPSCINNLTAMVREGMLTTQNIHQYQRSFSFGMVAMAETTDYVDYAMIQWQGNKREFSSNLRLLKSIDISSNKLTGKIPYELTDLHGLRALNFSTNALTGEIPRNINKMKELLTLDLSRNNLSGGLPSDMSQMNQLNYIDVSFNSLSGRIPSGTQFQTSEPSRYTGNAGLCGPPLTDHCPGDRELQVSQPINGSHGNDDGDNDELRRFFYIGGTTGFAVGFWIVCSVLLVNNHGRHTLFHSLDNLESMVYVNVMVFIAKFQRAAHT